MANKESWNLDCIPQGVLQVGFAPYRIFEIGSHLISGLIMRDVLASHMVIHQRGLELTLVSD